MAVDSTGGDGGAAVCGALCAGDVPDLLWQEGTAASEAAGVLLGMRAVARVLRPWRRCGARGTGPGEHARLARRGQGRIYGSVIKNRKSDELSGAEVEDL